MNISPFSSVVVWFPHPFFVLGAHSSAWRRVPRCGYVDGAIQRSAKAPNNSFFRNWISEKDSITWSVDVGQIGDYTAIVHYTCSKENTGTTIHLAIDGKDASAAATVTEAFDPPLYDKSKERVAGSHYFVKDFKPLEVGVLHLNQGRGLLRLTAPKIVGGRAIDVHSIELTQRPNR